MTRVRFRVTGRVQGVGFRAFTRRTAHELEVGGWVRNTADGAVEGEAEGDTDAIAQFVGALHRGPRMSQVRTVDTEDIALVGGDEFVIRH